MSIWSAILSLLPRNFVRDFDKTNFWDIESIDKSVRERFCRKSLWSLDFSLLGKPSTELFFLFCQSSQRTSIDWLIQSFETKKSFIFRILPFFFVFFLLIRIFFSFDPVLINNERVPEKQNEHRSKDFLVSEKKKNEFRFYQTTDVAKAVVQEKLARNWNSASLISIKFISESQFKCSDG